MAVMDFTFAKAIDDKHRLVIKIFAYFLFITIYLSENLFLDLFYHRLTKMYTLLSDLISESSDEYDSRRCNIDHYNFNIAWYHSSVFVMTLNAVLK